jgi:hypothetical protein
MAKLLITLMLLAAVVFVVVPPLGTNAAPFLWPEGYVLSNTPALQQREAVEGTFRVALDSQGKTIAGGNYALGFLDHNNSGKFTLSIVFSPFSSSPKGTEFWSANRNRPVGEKARLMRTAKAGILVLLDSDGTQVWSSGNSVESMELSDNGNWNLYNTTNVKAQNLAANTVWFSWQYPTNTLTIGQILRSGQKLVSNVSPTDPSEGHFSLVAEKGGLVLYNDNLPYWVWAFPGLSYEYIKNPCINSGTLIAQVVYAGNLFVLGNIGSASTISSSGNKNTSCSPTSLSDTLPFASSRSGDQSSLRFVRLDSDGNLRAYVALPMRGIIGGDPLVWTVDYELFPSCFNCSLPSVCGPYGVCSNGQCSCPAPDVFQMKAQFQPDAGCSPRLPLSLNCKGKQEMVEVKGVDYYPTKYSVDHETSTSSSSCKTLCLSNCTCVAAFFSSDSASTSCFLAFNRLDSLHVVTDPKRRALHSAFLKVQKA